MQNDLNIRIKINSDTKALEVTRDEFNKLGQSTQAASNDIGKSSDRISESIDNLSSKATKAAGIIAGVFAFDKLKDGAKEFLSTAGQFEQYAVSLEVLSGSAAKAQQGFDWIKDFTAKTPYTLDETTQAFIRLKAYGIDATDGSLKTLGDTSAALSKPLMSAVEAMADAMTGENERLKEFGITASVSGKKIAYNWMDSSGQAKTKLIDNNKQIIKSTLEAIFNEKYSGMMDKQSQTLNGMVSNFEDTWTNLENTITNNSGAFDVAKTSITGATTALQTMGDHLDDIVLYGKYTLEAASAIAIYKGAVIGVNTVQNLHAKYMAASTVATTTYNIATNTTTASVERLTFAQVALNTAMKANPWLIAGTAAVGLGVVLTNEMDKFNAASKNALDGVKNLQTADSVQKEIDRTVNALSESKKKIADWGGLDSIFGNRAIEEKNAARLENRLKFLGSKLSELGQTADATSSKVSNVSTPLTDAEIEKQKKAAEQLVKLNHDLNDDIFKATASEHEKDMKLIDDGVAKYREGGADKIKIAQLVSLKQAEYLEAEYAKAIGQFDALDKETAEKTKARLAISEDMYTKLNELSGNWYDNELLNTSKWVNDYIEKGGDIEKANEYLNASILKLDQKRIDEQSELAKKQWEEQNAGWLSFFDDFNKAMDNQLFDAMTGKWNDFGDWLKDFWGSITTSIARAASSQLANALIGGVQNFVIGSPGRASGLMGIIAGTMGVGSTLSADEITQLGGTAGQAFTTGGGTAVDAAGQITATGSDIMSIASSVSSLKTAYDVLTSGVSEYITGGFANASMDLYGSGILGLDSATALGNFGYGLANPLSGFGAGGAAGWGSLIGGVGLGAGVGYAMGSLGDLLFGANTKAGTYGAAGGALGAALGSVVPGIGTLIGGAIGSALGSVVGGMFGSTEFKGYKFSQDTSLANYDPNTIRRKYETDSWFGSDTSYKKLTDEDKRMISGMFSTYDYLLAQLDNFVGITIRKGSYSRKGLDKEVAKSFISEAAGIQRMIEVATTQTVVDLESGLITGAIRSIETIKIKENPEIGRLYNVWKSYAKSIDKTVMEALSESVSAMVNSKRSFETWSLERSGNTVESLRKQSEWLAADLQNLEHVMGVTGVTIENYTQMYSDAVSGNFDPTTISQWQSLGTALQSATDAQDAYTKALADTAAQQQQSALDSLNALGATYSTMSNTITNVQGMIDDINGVTMTLDKAGYDPEKIMQAYRDQSASINAQHTTRLTALNAEMESIKKIADYSKSLINAARSLRYSALSDSGKFEYSNSTLNALIATATGKLSSGADIADEVSRITDLSGNYAQLAHGYYATQAEFDYAVGTMANKIEALGGKGSTSTLNDVEAAINMENDSLSTALKALKDEASGRLQSVIDAYSTGQQLIADQMQSQLDSYAEFWGVDSPIVAKLQEILQSLGLQYSLNTSGAGSSSASAITDAYQNILGRTPDTAGADYWTSKINSGDLNTGEAGIAIGAAAATNGEISVSQYITDLYTQGLGRTPDASGLAYWNNVVSSGQLSIDQLASTFSSAAGSNGESFHKFKDGGLVKGGKGGIIGQIGEEDYDELILPLKDPNDPLGLKALRSDSLMMKQSDPMIALLGTIVTLLEKLGYDMNSVLSQISDNTKQSRRA